MVCVLGPACGPGIDSYTGIDARNISLDALRLLFFPLVLAGGADRDECILADETEEEGPGIRVAGGERLGGGRAGDRPGSWSELYVSCEEAPGIFSFLHWSLALVHSGIGGRRRASLAGHGCPVQSPAVWVSVSPTK